MLEENSPFGSFHWNWIPSVGKSGGILCGVRCDKLDIISCVKGKHMLQLVLLDRPKKLKWGLIVVYGPAHEELKGDFLVELAPTCIGMQVPWGRF